MTKTAMALPEVHLGRGRQVGPLTVFPVWTTQPPVAGLAVGAAASVRVSEREGSPVVGEVVVVNDGSAPALLLEGELLQGGWQDRAVAHDLILAAGGSAVADVVCVEAGRWQGSGGHERRARRAPASMRASLMAEDPTTRQARVWGRESQCSCRLGLSPTCALADHLDEITAGGGALGGGILGDPLPDAPEWGEALDVDAVVAEARALAPLDGQRGVVVGAAGYPVELEVLPTTADLARALPEMLTGLLLDAFADAIPAVPTPARRVRRLLERLDQLRVPVARGVDAGLGEPRSLLDGHDAVRGVTLDGQWAHLSVFNTRHALLEL